MRFGGVGLWVGFVICGNIQPAAGAEIGFQYSSHRTVEEMQSTPIMILGLELDGSVGGSYRMRGWYWKVESLERSAKGWCEIIGGRCCCGDGCVYHHLWG